ncbi:MAG TPA: 50S ribosomal protein L9 [Fontimonas sp.]
MEVILLEKIKKLGDLGDTVKVKSGFGRNFLLPQGKALPATENNRKVFEARKAELLKKSQDSLNAAKLRGEKLNGLSLTIPVLAAEEGRLYGSVGPAEIVHAAAAKGVEIHKNEIDMVSGPIRAVGTYTVSIALHSEVAATVTVVVEAQKATAG